MNPPDDVNNEVTNPPFNNNQNKEDNPPISALPSLPPVLPPIQISKVKCHAKGCPGLPESQHTVPTDCATEDCTKRVHRICYEKMIKKSKKPRAEHPTLEFCSCACQDKYDKSSVSTHLHWRNDGKNGPTDPEHSEHYIVQWLLTGENFAKWRSPSGGQTKLKVCERIATMLNGHGLKRVITPQMVYNKVQHIEGQMRSTYDWCSGSRTGVGLKETDPLSFNEKVCYYVIWL